MAPHAAAMPFALRVDSPVKNYDSGGMSVEGAKPAAGHLGAILYGASAQNAIRMEGKRTLFGAFAALDPRWAVVEYNSADLRQPKALPTYADAYRGLREMWNYGARYVSPMAWPGSSGRDAGRPGYDPFTAWRDTPLEDAARDFLVARAGLPLGSRLWTFGAAGHADDDGWTATRGRLAARPAHLALAPDAARRVELGLAARAAPGRGVRLARSWRSPRRVPSFRCAWKGAPTRARRGACSRRRRARSRTGRRAAGPALQQVRITLAARDAAGFPLARLALIPR